MKTLRPYQAETVETLADGGINASGLGAGKTLTSVEACRQLDPSARVLVVAPVTVMRHWRNTFVEQFPVLERKGLIHLVGTHRKDPETWRLLTGKEPGVFIIGWNAMHGGVPEDIRRRASRGVNANRAKPKATITAARRAIREGTVPPWTRTGTWDLLILDEAHRAANRHGVPRQVLKIIKADRIIAASATPAGGKPEGLWTLLNLIWPDLYPDFWGWVDRHFHVEEKVFYQGGRQDSVRTIAGEKWPGSVWKDIPAVVRYRTEEVADLPPIVEREVPVAMAPEQEEQYRDFERQSLAWLGDHPVAAQVPIEQRTRLRQAALGTLLAEEMARRVSYRLTRPERDIVQAWQAYRQNHPAASRRDFLAAHNGGLADGERHLDLTRLGRILVKQAKLDQGIESEEIEPELDIAYDPDAPQPKLDAVQDILADLPPDEPVLVWTHSARWARMAEQRLGSQAVAWTMKTTAAKRRKIEAGFGTEWRVLIAQLQSLSEGVDWLKDACRCEIIASSTEGIVWNEQAEGRLYRPGQTSPVQRWRLIAEGTIDEDVELNNLVKRTRMASLYGDAPRADEV